MIVVCVPHISRMSLHDFRACIRFSYVCFRYVRMRLYDFVKVLYDPRVHDCIISVCFVQLITYVFIRFSYAFVFCFFVCVYLIFVIFNDVHPFLAYIICVRDWTFFRMFVRVVFLWFPCMCFKSFSYVFVYVFPVLQCFHMIQQDLRVLKTIFVLFYKIFVCV